MDEPRDWRTSPALAPVVQQPADARSTGRWWVLLTVLTFGLANPYTFGYAAWKLRRDGTGLMAHCGG